MQWKRFIKKKPKKDGWYYCTIKRDPKGEARTCVPLYWKSSSRNFRLYYYAADIMSLKPGSYGPYYIANEDVIAWTYLPKPYSRKK